jgi:hypothetical protein
MRISLFLLPFAALGLAGCIDVHSHPAPRETTIVTPAPTAPVYAAPVYAAPGTSATVVTQP